jgi:DNA-binding NarL/FixJ family response regulator
VKTNATKSSATVGRKKPRSSIFIVEDHPLFRQGLLQVINAEPDLDGLRLCGRRPDCFSSHSQTKPDLAIIDISLPGKNGLALIKEVRQVDNRIKLLVISMHDEALYANRVLRAGGNGYVMKQEDPEQVVHAIRDVLNGHIYVRRRLLWAGSTHCPIVHYWEGSLWMS